MLFVSVATILLLLEKADTSSSSDDAITNNNKTLKKYSIVFDSIYGYRARYHYYCIDLHIFALLLQRTAGAGYLPNKVK